MSLAVRGTVLGRKRSPYAFKSGFTATIAATLPTVLAGDIGTMNTVDATGVMSQANGVLTMSGTPAAASGLITPAVLGRKPGRAFVFTVVTQPTVTATLRSGWDTGLLSAAAVIMGIDYNASATAVRIKSAAGANVDTFTMGAGVHCFAVILRSTGGYLLGRLTTSGDYTVIWVFGAGATSVYAKMTLIAGQAVPATVDDMMVVDLAGVWASDYAFATNRVAITTAGTTTTMTADGIVEHTITAATGVAQELWVRRASAADGWIVRMDQTGSTIKLIEIVASVETERASAAQTWTNGTSYRVVVICATQSIKTYVADVAKNSYASAATQQTTTGVLVDTAGTNLVAYPRTVTLTLP